MAKAIFTFNGDITTIQCNIKEKMKNICIKFAKKEDIDITKIYFKYEDQNINQELQFIQLANEEDKKKGVIKISVYENNNNANNNISPMNIIKSNEVICPECKEPALITIKNFKLNISSCENGHTTNNILLKDYENTQKIDLSKIICKDCEIKNKGNTFNNEFYKCINCNMNLCLLCKSAHDPNHKIINYNQINLTLCDSHNINYTKYCNQCNKNICIMCLKEEHKGHEFINYEDKLNVKNINDLKEHIDLLNKEIKDIIKRFENIINYMDNYYKFQFDYL